MHNKFMIINTPKRKLVTFGSMNLSVRSLHANHELLVITESPFLYQTMERRWSELLEVTKAWHKKQRRCSSRMSGLTQS